MSSFKNSVMPALGRRRQTQRNLVLEKKILFTSIAPPHFLKIRSFVFLILQDFLRFNFILFNYVELRVSTVSICT